MPSVTNKTGQEYWRSLDHLDNTPEYQAWAADEFRNYSPEDVMAPNRRQFLKFMGASLALVGGVAGCRRWPKQNVVPYGARPEGSAPGVPEYYASAYEIGGVGQPIVVSSYDGRPIKIEGNEVHPASGGASSLHAQASILETYDPERSRRPIRREDRTDVDSASNLASFLEFAGARFKDVRDNHGASLAILSEATSSPTIARLRAQIQESLSGAKWYEYEPVDRSNNLKGARLAYGEPKRLDYELAGANVIVSFDADLLTGQPNSTKYARDFAAGRRTVDDKEHAMSRLYVVESTFSNTGAMADHRTAVKAGDVKSVLVALAVALAKTDGLEIPEAATSLLGKLKSDSTSGENNDLVATIAADLVANQGKSVIAVGSNQPAALHALANVLNEALGNVGQTVIHRDEPNTDLTTGTIQSLAAEIEGESLRTVIVIGGNPAYDGPVELDFGNLLKGFHRRGGGREAIHLSVYDNETSKACSWHVNRATYLEGWADTRSYDGAVSIVQPIIRPLFQGLTAIQLLQLVLKGSYGDGEGAVRKTLADLDAKADWNTVLYDGLLPNNAAANGSVSLDPESLDGISDTLNAGSAGTSDASVEVTFAPHHSLYDGRFANNGWLQELPQPMTKVTWDNPALVSPATAERLGVTNGERISLRANKREIIVPVFILPGQPKDSIALHLGYGRTDAGSIGDGIGFDTYEFRTGADAYRIAAAKVSVVGGSYALASTQDHHAIDAVGYREREHRSAVLVREATKDEFTHHPDFVDHVVHLPQMVQPFHDPVSYEEGYRWGMSVDLNACTGCGACVVACQSENNVAVVGKDEVLSGREMAWLRIDRYFQGDPEDPKTVHMPVACQHCETAPCEQVCPVAATVHDSEGLNVMVYNRCVGTRYCGNNCPFKVRRFNYLDYHAKHPNKSTLSSITLDMPDTQQNTIDPVRKMGYNPDVTVRMRGVMEKCSYCTQRIQRGKIAAKNEGRVVADGEVTPACGQSCPTNAIVFGNLNDAESRVAKLRQNPRSYEVLEEYLLRTRTRYMARIRNPHPTLAESSGAAHDSHDGHDEHHKDAH